MKSNNTEAIQFSLLDYRLRVLGPAREIETLKGSLLTRCQEPPESHPDLIYQIESGGKGYRVFQVDEKRSLLFEVGNLEDLFWELEYNCLSKTLERNNHLVHLHGAAVALNGKGLVFLGKSRAGKSTLSLHLIQRGYQFITDEVVLLDPITKCLKPFPRNLLVRRATFESGEIRKRIREGRLNYEDFYGETKWLIDPLDAGAVEPSEPPKIGQIFCLQRDPDAKPLLEPMSSRLALEEMMRHSFNEAFLQQRTLDVLIQIVESSDVYRLRAPHGGVAWELLRDHLNLPEYSSV